MTTALRSQYEAITQECGQHPADMTVVFDAGQNSDANFVHLAGAGLRYVGSMPASDRPDLTSLPPPSASSRMRTVSAG
jgi:hypothetical protein